MLSPTANRIAGLIDEPEPIKTPRSDLQREASRKNGSRSHGPVTADGKAMSRMNALKHGLLARKITPPSDVRADDQMFRRASRMLLDELQPETFSQRTLIDALAHDYVILGRARAMVEAVSKPPAPPLPPGTTVDQWERYQQDSRRLRVLDSLLAACEAGRPFSCKSRDAGEIGDSLIALTNQLQEEIADIKEEKSSGHERSDPDEIREDEERCRLWAMLQPALKRMLDRKYQVATLSGERRPARGDRNRLRELMQSLREGVKLRLADQPEFAKRMEQRCSVKESRLAWAPQPLMLLEQYISRIERSIQKKLAALHPGFVYPK